MDVQGILTLVGLGFGAYFITKTGLRVDDRIEDKKRLALTLSTWAASNGLPGIAQVLADFAINDISGVIAGIRNLNAIASNPEAARDALDSFLRIQLDKKLSSTDGKQALVDYIEKKLNVKISAVAVNQPPTTLEPVNASLS